MIVFKIPGSITFIMILLTFSTISVGCSNTEKPPSNFNIQVTPARWSVNTKLATNLPVLDFADDNLVIMHDYLGLFIYNLNTDELEDSIDLQALGCDFSDDSSCRIAVSPTADMIWIWPVSSEPPYQYNRISRKSSITNDVSEKNIFKDFVITKDIPPEQLPVKSYRCSKNCTMINYGEYAGICALSEGMEYSEALQKEWSALELTASSIEIKTTDDKACFKVSIISSAPLPDNNLLQGMNEKYIYLKKGPDGWYVEGFWKDRKEGDSWQCLPKHL